MRITIDIDPSELQPSVQPSVKVEKSQKQASVEEATNAGGPPASLVEALGEKKEPEPATTDTAAQMVAQDAGAGPAWPVELTEEFLSSPRTTGNGS